MSPVQFHKNNIEAASRIHLQLPQWRLSDETLERLSQDDPNFESATTCLLKCVALNTLYGTQVLAIMPLAIKIHEKFSNGLNLSMSSSDAEVLVREIAELKLPRARKDVVRTSFSAKFCHFFVSNRLFHIYDDAAKETLKLHLGPLNIENDKYAPYSAFCKNLAKLRNLASIEDEGRALDRYLWLTGTCIKWIKHYNKYSIEKDAEINKELHNFLVSANNEQLNDLQRLLPTPQMFQEVEAIRIRLRRRPDDRTIG